MSQQGLPGKLGKSYLPFLTTSGSIKRNEVYHLLVDTACDLSHVHPKCMAMNYYREGEEEVSITVQMAPPLNTQTPWSTQEERLYS